MLWQFNLPAFISILAVAITTFASWLTWRRRFAAGGKLLFELMLSILFWTFCAAMVIISPDTPDKISWIKFEYLGVVTAVPLLLMFTLVFTHRKRVLTPLFLIALWTIPLVTIFLVFTNEIYHLIWKYFVLTSNDFGNWIIFVRGPAYWVYIAYAYLCVIASIVILILAYRQAKDPYRKQIGTILIGLLFPWLGNIIFNLDPNLILPGLDLTPISFAVTSWVLSWAFTTTGLLGLVSIAHRTLIENLQDGVIVIDTSNRIVETNLSTNLLLNRTSLPIGEDAFEVFQPWPDLAAALVQKVTRPIEIVLPGSPPRYLEARITPVLDSKKQVLGHLALLHETTARKRAELALHQKSLELEQLAITDALTGLFNRRNLYKFLEQEFKRAERYYIPVAFALFDIDGFKQINDTYGHLCGDTIIRSVAASLKHEIRTIDIAARVGGDEFFVIFPHTSQEQAWQVMDRLRHRLSQVKQKCGDITVSISAGVTAWTLGDSPEEVIRRVDRLLYRAKEQGKNRAAQGT